MTHSERTADGRIYDRHSAAFKSVSAYVVLGANSELVARIAFKFARSGLRTTCFFHVLGSPMVSAFAAGGGYDKASAAVHKAAHKAHATAGVRHLSAASVVKALAEAIKDEGRSWDGDIQAAGFRVLSAV